MIQSVVHPDGLKTYHSSLLTKAGVSHAFSTRIGPGRGPMDLGRSALLDPDSPENRPIAQRIKRLTLAMFSQTQPNPLHKKLSLNFISQVHGSRVHCVEQLPKPMTLFPEHAPKADAMISQIPQAALMIRIADCVPILVSTECGHGVAAIHAGWRGLMAGVIPAAIAQLADLRREHARSMIAAIGPCISKDQFEVGDEVVEQFKQNGHQDAVYHHPRWAKAHIDLVQTTRDQLIKCGLHESKIDEADFCTFRDHRHFHSHRRDAQQSGRMGAMIIASGSSDPPLLADRIREES